MSQECLLTNFLQIQACAQRPCGSPQVVMSLRLAPVGGQGTDESKKDFYFLGCRSPNVSHIAWISVGRHTFKFFLTLPFSMRLCVLTLPLVLDVLWMSGFAKAANAAAKIRQKNCVVWTMKI